MPFENFDIQLTDPREARVIGSPSGDTTDAWHLSLDVGAVMDEYHAMQQRAKADKSEYISLGDVLYRALIDGPISRLFYRSAGALQNGDTGLRLRLRIETPELLQIPWELLYSRDDGGFLSTIKEFSISRYLPVPNPVRLLRINLPLRILVVVSAPTDLPELNFEKEKNNLNEALASLTATQGVELIIEQDARREHLLSRLQNETFHVLHFIGHGGWVKNRGVVALEKVDRTSDPVDAETFAGILSACPSLRLVTLNACDTAKEENKTFSGVGSQLILQGIPAVVAMQEPILDKAAIGFVRHLYGSLAGGDSIDRAMTLTRQQLHLDQSEQPGAFSIPVLYLHAPEGELFQVVRSRKKRLVRVSQQIARLNEASAALSEWKELHDILQNLSKPVDSVYEMALNPQAVSFLSYAWAPFKQDRDGLLIPFASERVRYIGRRYQVTEEGPSGDEWAVRTIQLANVLDKQIIEKNSRQIQEISGELRTIIYKYMTICNQQMIDLLGQTKMLYNEAKEILESVRAEEDDLKRTTLNWSAIQEDLLDLEDRNNRISEWLRFHNLFDSLHVKFAAIHTTALHEKSVDPIAESWNDLRESLITNLWEQAKTISKIGQAYVESPDGSLEGDPWIVDIKRKSDQLTKHVGGNDLALTRESISNLRNSVEQHYTQIDRNIKSEMNDFTMRSVALQARVS
jgi:CHAT domain-containing protein